MSFRQELELTDDLLVPGPDEVPAFVTAVAQRLRDDFAESEGYQVTVDRHVGKKRMVCRVNAWRGPTRGFAVKFNLELPYLTSGSVSVTRYSRLRQIFVWLGAGAALVVVLTALVMSLAGRIGDLSGIAWFFVWVAATAVFAAAGWLVGTLATCLIGGSLPAEQLDEIGQTTLAAIEALQGE